MGSDKVEPRYTTPLHDEVLGKTNDILSPRKSEIYGKNTSI